MEIKPQDIKDFLHLYLNSVDVIIESVSDEYKSHFGHAPGHKTQLGPMLWMIVFEGHVKIKPILRKLSDMTEEERLKYGWTIEDTDEGIKVNWPFESFRLLCKDGWDLFGLIPAGLAIDKTSII